MTLEQERRELDRQWRDLERERREFTKYIEIEDRRIKQEENLFSMKMKILEEELKKLAAEKKEVEMKKAFYDRVTQFESYAFNQPEESKVVRGELFFRGVGTKQSLKKRYKDLIKIYHPDNVDGDNKTVLEINKEYDYLSQRFV